MRSIYKQGFTLLELLVAIALIGVLAIGLISSYDSSVRSGRDVRRKSDLQNIQKALEAYYEDNKTYPDATQLKFGQPLTHPTDNTISYMTLVPQDPVGGNTYYYDSPDGSYYYIYSCIENKNDGGPGVNQNGYAGTNCNCNNSNTTGGVATVCRFKLSSSNAP